MPAKRPRSGFSAASNCDKRRRKALCRRGSAAISALRAGPAASCAAASASSSKQTGFQRGGQVEYLIADRHSGPWALAVAAKNSERQVLDRKISIRRVGALDPAAQVGAVRFVELHALTPRCLVALSFVLVGPQGEITSRTLCRVSLIQAPATTAPQRPSHGAKDEEHRSQSPRCHRGTDNVRPEKRRDACPTGTRRHADRTSTRRIDLRRVEVEADRDQRR